MEKKIVILNDLNDKWAQEYKQQYGTYPSFFEHLHTLMFVSFGGKND